MRRKIRRILLTGILVFTAFEAFAQRFSVGTNVVDWLTLATMEVEASAAVSQNVTLHVGAELNPWTWKAGDQQTQFQNRQVSYWGGVRWWPWHVYSGWWAGIDGRYTVYNTGGILKRDTEEGDAYGGGLYGGYSIMLNAYWNLDLGFGVFGGWKKYTRYACPLCGVKTDQGEKVFFVPDARIAFQWIF